MAKQKLTADEESILKRQARRRLIGAIALTTVVVLVLPMVFDGEPPAITSNEIELLIPDKNKVEAFQVESAVPEVNAASAVAVVPVPVVASAVVPVSDVAEATVLPQQVQAGKIAHVQDKPKPEVAKSAKTEKPKTETKPVKHSAEIKPKAEAKPATGAHAVPHSGFVVQIGAFSNPATAKGLQEKLGKQGFHVYTEKVGANIRVRVGSFPTRDAAEKARHKLESQGLHPNVVSLGG